MDTMMVCVCVDVLEETKESKKAQLVSVSILWKMSIETYTTKPSASTRSIAFA